LDFGIAGEAGGDVTLPPLDSARSLKKADTVMTIYIMILDSILCISRKHEEKLIFFNYQKKKNPHTD